MAVENLDVYLIVCARCRTVFYPNAEKSNNWEVRQSSFGGKSVSRMGTKEDRLIFLLQ